LIGGGRKAWVCVFDMRSPGGNGARIKGRAFRLLPIVRGLIKVVGIAACDLQTSLRERRARITREGGQPPSVARALRPRGRGPSVMTKAPTDP